ncbi:MAG: hypothetical protein Q9219_004499 [cf. Caloplaca sp. 3 TL-2023]
MAFLPANSTIVPFGLGKRSFESVFDFTPASFFPADLGPSPNRCLQSRSLPQPDELGRGRKLLGHPPPHRRCRSAEFTIFQDNDEESTDKEETGIDLHDRLLKMASITNAALRLSSSYLRRDRDLLTNHRPSTSAARATPAQIQERRYNEWIAYLWKMGYIWRHNAKLLDSPWKRTPSGQFMRKGRTALGDVRCGGTDGNRMPDLLAEVEDEDIDFEGDEENWDRDFSRGSSGVVVGREGGSEEEGRLEGVVWRLRKEGGVEVEEEGLCVGRGVRFEKRVRMMGWEDLVSGVVLF